jgi:hypothetical protein
MSAKGVENVGGPSEVENYFGWSRVLHSLNLQSHRERKKGKKKKIKLNEYIMRRKLRLQNNLLHN